jgi:hypothetical protein
MKHNKAIIILVIAIVFIGIFGTSYYQNNLTSNQLSRLQVAYDNLLSLYNQLQNQIGDSTSSPVNPATVVPSNLGWTGYVQTAEEVVPLLDRLKAGGWDIIRYQAVPQWALSKHVGYASTLNYMVLNLLVDEATKRNMTVYLLCAHCWMGNSNGSIGGSGNFIDGHEQEWISLWLDLANRYKNKNIVIDAWNEYSSDKGTVRYKALAQSLIDSLRNSGLRFKCISISGGTAPYLP